MLRRQLLKRTLLKAPLIFMGLVDRMVPSFSIKKVLRFLYYSISVRILKTLVTLSPIITMSFNMTNIDQVILSKTFNASNSQVFSHINVSGT